MPGFLEALGEFAEGVQGAREIQALVSIPRHQACDILLKQKVMVLPREALEDYQHRFAQTASGPFLSAEKRVRAMELYVMLHILAFNYYQNDFLGFFTDDHPLS